MIKKKTKVYLQVEKCYSSILNGRLLAIDPSTGSQASMPGYALFEQTKLVESGIIQVNPADRRNQKLYSITQSLQSELPAPDVLAIENIPPISFNRAGAMSGWSLVSIQRAIGAIISVYNCEYVEVAPMAWQRFKPADYVKSDEWDAISIGMCVIELAREINLKKSGG